jgi:hypothetical protein
MWYDFDKAIAADQLFNIQGYRWNAISKTGFLIFFFAARPLIDRSVYAIE